MQTNLQNFKIKNLHNTSINLKTILILYIVGLWSTLYFSYLGLCASELPIKYILSYTY